MAARRFTVKTNPASEGDVLNFPDGVTDSDIKGALDQRYGANKYTIEDTPMVNITPGETLSRGSGEFIQPDERARAPIPQNQGANPDQSGQPNISVDAANWKKLTPAQQTSWTAFTQSPDFDPHAPYGSPAHPIVYAPGTAPPPVGYAWMDTDGHLHSDFKGQSNDLLGFYDATERPTANVMDWMRQGLGHVIGEDNANRFDEWANGLVGLPRSDKYIEDLDRTRAMGAAAGQRPGTLGSMAGGTVGTLPYVIATRNPFLGGAVAGGISSEDHNNPAAVAGNAVVGGALGKATDLGLRGAGAVIAPRVNPLVRRLLDQGVELTPGQTVGGVPHRLEDATRSIYGLGDLVINSQANAQRSFNRGAVQMALDDVGVRIPRNVPEGHAQVDFAQRTLSDAYERVLPQINARMDQQFAQGIVNLRQVAQGLPPDQAHVFNSFYDGDLRRAFSNPGNITGVGFKQLEEKLGTRIRSLRSSPNPHDRDLASAFGEMQIELRELVARNNPQAAEAITAINSGYAKLMRVETAASGAKGGVFTPEALRQATRQMDSTARNRASARGGALMQDYADAGSQVMSNTVPDSGTPARALATGLAGYALFGGSSTHGLSVNPWAASALALAAAPYATRTTGAMTRAALTARPAAAGAVRQGVEAVAATNLPQSVAGTMQHHRHRVKPLEHTTP